MTREQAEAARVERAQQASEPINDARLPAGSPMHYYCRGCTVLVDTRPEGWWRDPPPPKFCEPCAEMVEKGWLQA